MSSGTHSTDASALLRAQHAVAAVLGCTGSREEAIAGVLEAIGESLGAAAGRLWEPAENGELGCCGTWQAPWSEERPADAELAREALDTGKPAWRGDALCCPLVGMGGPVGVIELHRPGAAQPDGDLLETLTALGRHIGQHFERRRAEADLRRSDAYLRATLNAAFDAIVTMDAEGTIVGANPATEALFGRPADELLGQELAATIIPPALREGHRRGLRDYVATGAQRVLGHPVELRAMHADGTEFPVEVAIRRLDVPGPPVFTGFIRDLTARRAAEAEVRSLAEEQAALRRVATLVARGADQTTVFSAVTGEVARLFGAQTVNMIRYRSDDTARVIGAWSDGDAPNIPVGATVPLEGDSAGPRIRRTGAPVRDDAFTPGAGPLGQVLRTLDFTSAIGAPIV